jgi:Leucine-rich repeat (LRR) protein
MEANRITQFPPNFFKGLSNLQQLSFQNNLVTALPQNLFAGTSLTQVDLSNNPLKQCAISRTDKALENSKVCYSATQ